MLEDGAPPTLLYHYTNRVGLIGIIESRILWATHIRYLNDESEVRYSRELMQVVADRLRREFRSDWAADVVCEAVAALAHSGTSPDTFAASFCEDGDNLSQWRGYGMSGQGFAIGFRRESLRRIALAQGFQMARLMYTTGEQEKHFETVLRDAVRILAGWAADRNTAPPAAHQLLLLGIGFTLATLNVKNPYFRDEKEWRLVHVIIPGLFDGNPKMRPTPNGDIPYEEISLADQVTGETPFVEVVIGPIALSQTLVGEIRDLLDRSGLQHVPIRSSLVPLRY